MNDPHHPSRRDTPNFHQQQILRRHCRVRNGLEQHPTPGHSPGSQPWAPSPRLPLTMAATILAVTGLVLTQGIPADGGAAAAVDEATRAQGSSTTQAFAVDDAAAVTVSRDSYTVTAAPPPPPRFASAAPGPGSEFFANSPGSAVQWPFDSSPISSGFGSRAAPCGGCSSNHKGLDFVPGEGTPITAIAGGVVRVALDSPSGWGTHVIIDHEIGGQRVSSLYAHMQAGSVSLAPGQSIAVGTQIGTVGNTGMSTGPHLHFEIQLDGLPVDPFAWLTANAG